MAILKSCSSKEREIFDMVIRYAHLCGTKKFVNLQCAKKVLSSNPGFVDFSSWIFASITCPLKQVKFLNFLVGIWSCL